MDYVTATSFHLFNKFSWFFRFEWMEIWSPVIQICRFKNSFEEDSLIDVKLAASSIFLSAEEELIKRAVSGKNSCSQLLWRHRSLCKYWSEKKNEWQDRCIRKANTNLTLTGNWAQKLTVQHTAHAHVLGPEAFLRLKKYSKMKANLRSALRFHENQRRIIFLLLLFYFNFCNFFSLFFSFFFFFVFFSFSYFNFITYFNFFSYFSYFSYFFRIFFSFDFSSILA